MARPKDSMPELLLRNRETELPTPNAYRRFLDDECDGYDEEALAADITGDKL